MWWVTQWIKSAGDNFGVVVPGRIYRGSAPDKDRLRELKDKYNIGLVLNLREGERHDDARTAARLGLLWAHVPMVDDAAPTHEQISTALNILRDPASPPIYMACAGGRHRAGVVAACYRVVVQGWSEYEAWHECDKFGWYDSGGHKPIRLWFETQFDPKDFP